MKSVGRIYALIVCLSVASVGKVTAQNELDALRYSQINVLGTARYSAMGGAFGALGGDMSGMSVNPAGIGVFTKTTGSASLAIISSGSDATYLGSTATDGKLNANISNAGFVARFTRRKGEEKQWAWKAFHLGVSYNRTANFHRRTGIIGVNTQSSAIDGWVNQLNDQSVHYSDIPNNDLVPGADLTNAYMGWGTFLIDTTPGSVSSYMRNVLPFYGQTERVRETTKGSMGEIAISFGGDFGNALYVGATIGIPRIRYEMERSYTESDTQDTIANFNSFTKTDYLKTTANGFNFKFGLIYRPVRWLRIGGAIHSPTYFEVDESFKSIVVSNVFSSTYTMSTLQGAFDYSLQTPFRAIGSLAFVIGKVGLVTAEYEYVNYSLAKFRSRGYAFDFENARVKNQLHWAGNIRVGTEWRISAISLRAGFGINGDPYTGKYNFNDTRYSLGAGYRLDRFFVDLSYQLHRSVGVYQVYESAVVSPAETLTLDHGIITTVGFRF